MYIWLRIRALIDSNLRYSLLLLSETQLVETSGDFPVHELPPPQIGMSTRYDADGTRCRDFQSHQPSSRSFFQGFGNSFLGQTRSEPKLQDNILTSHVQADLKDASSFFGQFGRSDFLKSSP